MSERSLFDVRYTFPGYTFLLFTILMCFEKLLTYSDLKFNLISLLFGVFFLLSGAPIGYFVSQLWYLYFHHWKKGYYWKDRCKTKKKEYVCYLCELINEDIKVIDNPDKCLVVIDYLFNISKERDKLRSYITRRWDLYHIMGSTEVSIIAGIFFGILLKPYLIYDKFIQLKDIWTFISFYFDTLISKFFESFYFKDLIVVFVGIVLILFFQIGKKRINKEHEDMVDILIRNINVNEIKRLKENLRDRSNEFFKAGNLDQ